MTTESTSSFFTNPSNTALMRRLVHVLSTWSDDMTTPKGLSHHLQKILELMLSNPERFDEFASQNIEWIGSNFISEISNLFELKPEKQSESITSIFTSAYRFLCELEFTQPGSASFDILRIMNFVHDNLDDFSGIDKQQLVYASYSMPAGVIKKLIGHPSIIEFRKFSETVESSRKLKEEWDNDLNSRQNLLQGLSENLRKITSAYNFVGLVNGFQSLKSAKETERRVSFLSLLMIAIAMLALPAIQVRFVMDNLALIDSYKTTLVYSLPTILAIELFLLYFFRVVLGQFRSVKAQLLQIDLRISLCQFIESYADYVTNLRTKDSSALGKFEALIFSGLVTEESGIPSTFDGIEQITGLIKSIRGEAKP